MICLLKRYCLIGQSGWREIRDAFPVIRWVAQNKDLGAAWKNKPWLEYTCYAAYVADVDGDSEASWQTMQSPVYKKLFTSKDNSTSNENMTAHWKDWKWLPPVQNFRLCHCSIPGRPGRPWSTLVSSGFRSACAVAAVVTLSLINLAITTTDVSSFKIEVPTTINRNKNRKCLGGL